MSFNTEIDTYLLNLKIISKLEENDKLITTDKLLKIDKPTIFQGVHRWMSNESRSNTLEVLNQIYENSFDITDILLNKEKEATENKKMVLNQTLEDYADVKINTIKNTICVFVEYFWPWVAIDF